jgi:hypothetical protein
MMLCILVDKCQYFGESATFRVEKSSNLKVEAADFSEILLYKLQNTRHHIREDHNKMIKLPLVKGHGVL